MLSTYPNLGTGKVMPEHIHCHHYSGELGSYCCVCHKIAQAQLTQVITISTQESMK